MNRSRSACVSRVLTALTCTVACLLLASLAVIAQQAPAKKPDPAVLIGPTRVTLVGGKTIEGIAVFREPTRVRVVLEDGTEIAFDPARVVSVVALADLPDAPPPAPKAKTAPAAARGAGKTPAKVHAEPAGGARPARARNASAGKSAPADGAIESGAEAGAEEGGAETAGAATARQKEERRREVEELAGMLQAAIANAALEGARTGDPGGPNDGPTGDEVGKDVRGGAETPAQPAEAADDKKPYKPKPEDFDATRPVNKAGYRSLGPKIKGLPETPPQSDFPKPAAPTTDLGFKADVWRPSAGFSSSAKWPKPLEPATSFPNRLSGLDRPITSFGPRLWNPTATRWSSSIFPQTWKPMDGFVQDQERKSPAKTPPQNPPADQNK